MGRLLRGQSAVRVVSRFDPTPFRARLAAEIDDFRSRLTICPQRRARRLDRFSQFAVASAKQAIDDAGLCDSSRTRWAATSGSALGGVAFGETQHQAYLQDGVRGVNPALALAVFGGAGSSNVAIELGLNGPSIANSNSCASGAIAIGEAFRLVRDGLAPAMLAGGVEAPLAPLTFGSFALIKAMSTRAGEPEHAPVGPSTSSATASSWAKARACWCSNRSSMPKARGAHIYAELRGYAHHQRRAPHARAVARRPTGRARDVPRPPGRGTWTRATSTTSTPTPAPRPSATAPRRAPSAVALGAKSRARCPSAAPRACTAIRWAHRARSKRPSARWPSSTASCPARPT